MQEVVSGRPAYTCLAYGSVRVIHVNGDNVRRTQRDDRYARWKRSSQYS